MTITDEVQQAKELLRANGFIVLTAKSYYAAQERQRCAEVTAQSAIADRDGQRQWMERDIFPRLDHLSDRLTFVYGIARARGASVVELGGSVDLPADAPNCSGRETASPDLVHPAAMLTVVPADV